MFVQEFMTEFFFKHEAKSWNVKSVVNMYFFLEVFINNHFASFCWVRADDFLKEFFNSYFASFYKECADDMSKRYSAIGNQASFDLSAFFLVLIFSLIKYE